MNWSALAAVLLALAVGFGAFGAHALRDRLDAYSMGVYEKAVFYHFVHALGMLAVGALRRAGGLTPASSGTVGALLLAGIVFFSGSLYVLALTGVRKLGMITPLGGVAFLLAWGWLAYALYREH